MKPGVGWQVDADLDRALRFPSHFAVIQHSPDLIILSDVVKKKKKKVIIVELTVPWEGNMEWADERKLCRYEEVREVCDDHGWMCDVLPVEVGCSGLWQSLKYLKIIRASSKQVKNAVTQLQEAAEIASLWIWRQRRVQ